MSFLIDSYPSSNTATYGTMYSGSLIYRGQSFTNTNSDILVSAVFNLQKSGSPTGNAIAKIYAHSGTYGTDSVPTGQALATSDAFDVSSLTGSYQLVTFNFTGNNQITLSASTYYCVEINYQGGDASNFLQVAVGGTGASGNWNFSTNGSSWYGDNARDVVFYIYGTTKVSRKNANKDENGVSTLLGTLNSDGKTVVPVQINPATGGIICNDGTSGTYVSRTNDLRDENDVKAMMGVSDTDNTTPTLVYADSNGVLQIKST